MLAPIPGQPGLFRVQHRPLEGFGEFGPSIFNTPQSRIAYVIEVNRRFLALDQDIFGTSKTDDRLRDEWKALYSNWQSFVEDSIGPKSNWAKRLVNQWIPFTLVETAQRFDLQRQDFAKQLGALGVNVTLPDGPPLAEPIDLQAVLISAAVTAVAAWAIFKGPSFVTKPSPKEEPKPKGKRGGSREAQPQRA